MSTNTIWRRIANTMTWCTQRGDPGDPRCSLRSVALQPPRYDPLREWQRYNWSESLTARVAIVDALESLRTHLGGFGAAHDGRSDAARIGGRFMLYFPDYNLYDGAAELVSNGYFDVDNAPPWDTWIAYLVVDADISQEVVSSHTNGNMHVPLSFLLAWVPREFLDLADAGIWANPEQCICWAEDAEPAVLDRLRQIDLISTPSKRHRDAERRKALDEMTALAEELGVYD